jgi:hypothetical protein
MSGHATTERDELATLTALLLAVRRRHPRRPDARTVHLHPAALRRYRELAARYYGPTEKTLEDLVGLQVAEDAELAPGEVALR